MTPSNSFSGGGAGLRGPNGTPIDAASFRGASQAKGTAEELRDLKVEHQALIVERDGLKAELDQALGHVLSMGAELGKLKSHIESLPKHAGVPVGSEPIEADTVSAGGKRPGKKVRNG